MLFVTLQVSCKLRKVKTRVVKKRRQIYTPMAMKALATLLFAALFFLGIFSAYRTYKWQIKERAFMQVPSLDKQLAAMETDDKAPILLFIDCGRLDDSLKVTLSSITAQHYDLYEIYLCVPTELAGRLSDSLVGNYQVILGSDEERERGIAEKIKSLRGNEIVALLSSGDWLTNPYVFGLLNHAFELKNFSCLLGQYIHYPSYNQGVVAKKIKKEVKKGKLGSDPALLGAFKAFRASYLQAHPNVPLLQMNREGALIKTLVKEKSFFFSPYVYSVQNDLAEGHTEPIIQW